MRSPLNDALNRKWSEASATLEKLERELAAEREKIACIEMDRDHARLDAKTERERADRNQEDAERYRYLRIHPSVASETLPSSYQRFWCLVELDTAIDAARRKANAAILKATGDRLDALNRRAAVEQILFDAAAGKRHLPGPEECRALAMKLGVPDELRDPRFDAMLRGESNG